MYALLAGPVTVGETHCSVVIEKYLRPNKDRDRLCLLLPNPALKFTSEYDNLCTVVVQGTTIQHELLHADQETPRLNGFGDFVGMRSNICWW